MPMKWFLFNVEEMKIILLERMARLINTDVLMKGLISRIISIKSNSLKMGTNYL